MSGQATGIVVFGILLISTIPIACVVHVWARVQTASCDEDGAVIDADGREATQGATMKEGREERGKEK